MDKGAESYARFLSGDEQGLYEIVRDYRDGLILYLNSIVGDIYLAEDLAEDTLVKLCLKKPANHREKGSFKTWLYTIGRNLALDRLRKRKKEVFEDIEAHQELVQEEKELLERVIAEERKQVLYEAMKKLNHDQCQVLWLRYMEGLSSKETAAVMKKTVRNVDTLALRARQALKKELENGGFTYEDL